MKKPMDDLTKAKLVYSGELAVFALLFAVLGILFLTGVLSVSDWKRWVFGIGTLIGGILLVADLIWALASPKRRAKICLLDKIIVAPMGLGMAIFDIIALSSGWMNDAAKGALPFRFAIGVALCYYAVAYCFEAIYHWKYPLPAIIEAAEEDSKEDLSKAPTGIVEQHTKEEQSKDQKE